LNVAALTKPLFIFKSSYTQSHTIIHELKHVTALTKPLFISKSSYTQPHTSIHELKHVAALTKPLFIVKSNYTQSHTIIHTLQSMSDCSGLEDPCNACHANALTKPHISLLNLALYLLTQLTHTYTHAHTHTHYTTPTHAQIRYIICIYIIACNILLTFVLI
jgi:hypothetical protein